MNKREAYIVAFGRSAIAKSHQTGALRYTRPEDVASEVLEAVLAKVPDFDRGLIEDVVIGCAFPESEQGMNLAKVIADRTGLPETVPGQTVNRFCSSGLQSIADGASYIKSGMMDVVVAGGVEFMSTVPMGGERPAPNPTLLANHPSTYVPMGITAENVADKYQISREAQEAFAVESHQRANAAQEAGRFSEIVPVSAYRVDQAGNLVAERFDKDQGIRPNSTVASLAKLRPAFKLGGSVTAATSSQTSDGAAMVLLMSGEMVEKLGVKPIARFVQYAVAGLDPAYMGLGPINAINQLLAKTKKAITDIDLFEINEAFASQALASIQELNIPFEKVNVNGGALAMGHPLGATGSILTAKLLSEMGRRAVKYGVVSMCVGGGMGAAALYEYS